MAVITSYWGLDGMILMIIAAVGAYVYMTRKFLYWKNRGVVEISPIPFVGNFSDCLLMKKSPGQFVRELYEKFSNVPYMGFYILDRPFFLVRDIELIKNMLVRDFAHFTDRYASTCSNDSMGNSMLFFLNNPQWKLVRTKLTPAFTSGRLKKMFDLMLKVGEDLDSYLTSLHLEGEGRTLEMKELCAKYTTDIIGTTVYGLQVNSLNNPNAEFRKNGREIFNFNFWRSMEMTSFFFAPQLSNIMGFKFFTKKNEKFLREAIWDTLNEREKSGIKRNDFIDLMIELKSNQAETEEKLFEFEGDNLVAQASAFFAAGFETASTAISFTSYELALAPEVQKKLRAEIRESVKQNDGKITYEMVTKLPYLDMVVSEGLRKYPSLPFLDRVVTADYKVPHSNIVLPKGMPVYIPMLGLHYDPKYFPNPEVFDPERFSEKNKMNREAFAYMPFGAGPRLCIAARLGMLETKLGLIHIIMNYELSPCKETPIPMKINPQSFLTASEGGIHLNVRKLDDFE